MMVTGKWSRYTGNERDFRSCKSIEEGGWKHESQRLSCFHPAGFWKLTRLIWRVRVECVRRIVSSNINISRRRLVKKTHHLLEVRGYLPLSKDSSSWVSWRIVGERIWGGRRPPVFCSVSRDKAVVFVWFSVVVFVWYFLLAGMFHRMVCCPWTSIFRKSPLRWSHLGTTYTGSWILLYMADVFFLLNAFAWFWLLDSQLMQFECI